MSTVDDLGQSQGSDELYADDVVVVVKMSEAQPV